MNKRIQELAEQARTKVPADLVVSEWIDTYNHVFAQLIVQECAKIADTEKSNSVGCGYITKTIGMRIKQHFGVKV